MKHAPPYRYVNNHARRPVSRRSGHRQVRRPRAHAVRAAGDLGREMSHTEIAEALGIPKSSLTQLLRNMVSRDWLAYSPSSKGYTLGSAFGRLARRAGRAADLASVAGPVLAELTARTAESSALNVLKGDMAEVAATVLGPQRLVSHMRLGDLAPAIRDVRGEGDPGPSAGRDAGRVSAPGDVRAGDPGHHPHRPGAAHPVAQDTAGRPRLVVRGMDARASPAWPGRCFRHPATCSAPSTWPCRRCATPTRSARAWPTRWPARWRRSARGSARRRCARLTAAAFPKKRPEHTCARWRRRPFSMARCASTSRADPNR